MIDRLNNHTGSAVANQEPQVIVEKPYAIPHGAARHDRAGRQLYPHSRRFSVYGENPRQGIVFPIFLEHQLIVVPFDVYFYGVHDTFAFQYTNTSIYIIRIEASYPMANATVMVWRITSSTPHLHDELPRRRPGCPPWGYSPPTGKFAVSVRFQQFSNARFTLLRHQCR